MRPLILLLLAFLLATAAFGQEWQSYPLTDYPSGGVRQCGSVMDTLGNAHHYFITALGDIDFTWQTYYMRTDMYGRVLTDTVRLDTYTGPYSHSSFTSVVGDGANSWCVFSQADGPEWHHGLVVSGHGPQGNVILPTTLLGYPGGGDGPPSWDLAAVYRPADQTIHLVGNTLPYYYYRFKVIGPDTQIWHQPIDSVVMGVDPEIHLGPDGTPWAAMRSDIVTGGTEILLVRFGDDGRQTAYYPFGRDVSSWYVHDFGIDAHYNFHFMVSSDTVNLAYIRLDSSLQVQEVYTLDPLFDGYGTMKADPAGNCLFIWNRYPGLHWAYRAADGVWDQMPAEIAHLTRACSFSILAMDSNTFAFTAMCAEQGQSYLQLRLYTYGWPPPNDVAGSPRPPQTAQIAAYPNPFTTSLNLELPVAARELTIYDILGRAVWTQSLTTESRRIALAEPRLNQLPSGVYFLSVDGQGLKQRLPLVHVR